MSRNIIAISGSGFSYGIPSYIDEYILSQIRTNQPIKICFIPTASDDSPGYIAKFYKAFEHCQASHIAQVDFTKDHVKEFVTQQDVIYVGGGNTHFMLSKWRDAKFDEWLKEAYLNGTVIAGISAGAMCWFETCYDEVKEGSFEEFEGLGWLPGTFFPHYNKPGLKQVYEAWQSTSLIQPSYPLSNPESLHFRDERLIAKITI